MILILILKLGESLLRLCLREVFSFRFMQTDPNWSNFFYNKKTGQVYTCFTLGQTLVLRNCLSNHQDLSQIELLDFGACREYSSDFLNKYGNILVSAARGDRDGVWEHSKTLNFVTGYETPVSYRRLCNCFKAAVLI
jgi:predicted unusual protein kinase regulating ubiquinone biosynthesis (AarF/ABC1/UbiB family)